MSTVHRVDGQFIQYTKGAPDVILDRCVTYLKDGKSVPMTDEYLIAIALGVLVIPTVEIVKIVQRKLEK